MMNILGNVVILVFGLIIGTIATMFASLYFCNCEDIEQIECNDTNIFNNLQMYGIYAEDIVFTHNNITINYFVQNRSYLIDGKPFNIVGENASYSITMTQQQINILNMVARIDKEFYGEE